MTPSARAVLAELRRHAWHTPTCRRSVEHLARDLGLGERTVWRARKELERDGWVSVAKDRAPGAKYQHNVYTILRGWKPRTPRQIRAHIRLCERRRRPAREWQVEQSERRATSPTATPTCSPPSIDFDSTPRPERRLSASGLAEHLRSHGKRVRGHGDRFTACCPGHDDHEPSLTIGFKDGRTLLHCHAGCEPEDVLRAAGLHWRDLEGYPDRHRRPLPQPRHPSRRTPHRTAPTATPPTKVDTPRPPTEADWSRIWDDLSFGRAPRCAILGAD